MVTASPLRTQVKREQAAKKKEIKGLKSKTGVSVIRGRKLRIRA